MRGVVISFLLLFTTVNCGPCPDGYAQAPHGGDCFKTINFRDFFSGNLFPTSFDEADTACSNDYSGGLLAAIHSPEENDFVRNGNTPNGNMYCDVPTSTGRNIGLRCNGKNCKWDDGSPVTYTKFAGDGPSENDGESCYAIEGSNGEWYRKKCGKQDSDCWICKVKARTIDCIDGEIEYKGGCVSVHTSPLDQKSAESYCSGGGHLASLHSKNDVVFYKNAALNASVTGSIYIGGQYSNGLFEWVDGSCNNYAYWANSFPNTIFGTCAQMLLDSEFGVQGQWTNIDCSTKQPYICFRDGATYDPTPSYPKADARSPSTQYYYLHSYDDVEYIYSPNYPISIPNHQKCEYWLQTLGSPAGVKFTTYDCHSGVTLEFWDSLFSDGPFMTFTTDCPVIDQYYNSTRSILIMRFNTNGTSAPEGTGWAATFNAMLG